MTHKHQTIKMATSSNISLLQQTKVNEMKELNLQYERGSEPNTIDVLTQDGLLLGVITGQTFLFVLLYSSNNQQI